MNYRIRNSTLSIQMAREGGKGGLESDQGDTSYDTLRRASNYFGRTSVILVEEISCILYPLEFGGSISCNITHGLECTLGQYIHLPILK